VKFWDMDPNLRKALENLGVVQNHEVLPTEIEEQEKSLYPEGAIIVTYVDRFERSKEARAIALQEHGNTCKGCQIDFKQIYGDDMKEIIEVHHIHHLKDGSRQTNPHTDLIPLCPNCHAVVHSNPNQLMSIKELQMRVENRRR
ncbi:MAG: HNH endonuclease, partial [Chitinophagaceae bacterium]